MDIGLIGCGRVARIHMSAYGNIPEANVVALSDLNLENANAFAQNYGIKQVFNDYSKLLEMKNLDFVDICTPTSTHAEIACEVAKFGQNILLEKPMARNTADCDKIINEVSKQGVKLSICHNQLFLPQVMQAKTIIDSGDFDLIHSRVSVNESHALLGAPGWIMTPEQGGLLWETGCHTSYLQLHFLDNVTDVFAIGDKVKHPVEDHFAAVLGTSNKALGVIEVSSLAKVPEVVFEFISREGKLMKILNYNQFSVSPDKLPGSFVKGFYLEQKTLIKKWMKTVMDSVRKRSLLTCLDHYILINKYLQYLKDDSEPPVKPEDGRNAIKLLECMEESLKTGHSVKMKK
jgi:UDP-N-acetyl-2-amino-2-deoxyglucuronate dehydrogenase